MVKIKSQRGGIDRTAYHLVGCPKYRRDIHTQPVAQTVETLLENICDKNRWNLISKEIQPDDIHIFVSLPPVLAIAQALRSLKGAPPNKL
jgi:putative transposase